MITLEQLIIVAPFSDEMRKELLEKLDSLSESKRFELMDLCWETINLDYQNKLNYAMQKATLEMAHGQKNYSKEDFQKMENDLFDELIKKLESAGSKVAIEEVREKLSSYTKPKNQSS